MKKAAVLCANGFEEAELTVPFDLLREAGVEVDLVSVDGQEEVCGTNGLRILCNAKIGDYDFSQADALIVPGGAGAMVIKDSKPACQAIRLFAQNPDKILGAICAGSAIVGEMGLFKGKNYVCVPDMNKDFGGTFKLKYAVADGTLVTGISVGGAFEFGFDLVEKLAGKEEKEKLENQTCYHLEHRLDSPIMHRRSIRSFTKDKPDEKLIEEILAAAMAAPSATNQRPWQFYVTDNPEKMKELASSSPYALPAGKAPWLIALCYSKNVRVPEYDQIDSAIAAQNLMLAADACGLGSVFLGIAPEEDRMRKAKQVLNLPEDEECFALIPVGYAAKDPEYRETFEADRIHRF